MKSKFSRGSESMKAGHPLMTILPVASLAAPAVHAPTCATLSSVEPRFGSTKLAAATLRGALTLAALSALLLVAVHPAQAQTETVLYSFTNAGDGGDPYNKLTLQNGNFYGTTRQGGSDGYGVVFELSPNGKGGWNESVLHSFTETLTEPPDGSFPTSYVIFDKAGNLYGTTSGGSGTVFKLSPAGTSWTETILHSFEGADGNQPQSGLIMDSAGNLYGTTLTGGTQKGTVFELTPSGSGWTERVIYDVENSPSGVTAGLTMDAAGNIFGASSSQVFELSPNANGGFNPTVIHTFPKGTNAEGTPVLDNAGNLYGTTYSGGEHKGGMVYRLSPKSGTWTLEILYSFPFNLNGQGDFPVGGVVLDPEGNIYGTTMAGGQTGELCSIFDPFGCGTIFELVAPTGTGSYQEKNLLEFDGLNGLYPLGSLIQDSSGKLYGTTELGGSVGFGAVFELTPSLP